MTTIVTRQGKGSPLTYSEMDTNFTNLNGNKLETVSPVISSGDLTFSGTGQRIKGDFSNGTPSNRVTFQSNTVNGNTNIRAIPNGSSRQSYIQAANNPDADNCSIFSLGITDSFAILNSAANGTGTVLPIIAQIAGVERLRIDTVGNIGIGSAPSADSRLFSYGETSDSTKYAFVARNSSGNNLLSVRNDGSVLANQPVGLGYGPGAGGTVIQATSKSTAVTLNKPSGTILMNAASLAAGATAAFLVQNSIIGAETDSVICGIIASSVSNQLSYTLTCNPGNGGFYIILTNRSAGALAEAVRIKFDIIKGANS